MTNEEAIKRLKSDIYKYSDFTENPNENEFWTAFDMAIKALEQELCENCVSRADVKEQMIKYGFTAPDMTVTEFVEECLQPVTPQPKIGRWIFDEILDKHYYCSECKSMGVDYWDFCPDCGAKMQEVKE